jgi:hypothetical protein
MTATSHFPRVLPIRERAALINGALAERLDRVLPEAMRAAGIDAWLIVCQEDNLDPIFQTMIPMDTWCPILQILLFIGHGDRIERLNISGTNTHALYDRPYAGQLVEEQWAQLIAALERADPRCIGLNIGSVQWAAGGLTHNLYEQLHARLPRQFHERFVSAEVAATHWATSLTETDIATYEHVCNVAHAVIAETYSRAAIVPGHTTLDDLTWFYWQRCSDLGLPMSFKPSFRLIRGSEAKEKHGETDTVIRSGDLIHCDVGFQYLRFHSDHQQIAYVLEPGETEAPTGLNALLAEGTRLQNLFMSAFETGITGDELLAKILASAETLHIPGAKVYSHSVGLFLHEPGPLIGLPWEQISNPGRGDVRVIANSCFTMELSVTGPVPEWGDEAVRLPLEEDVVWDGTVCRPLDGRQTAFHLI